MVGQLLRFAPLLALLAVVIPSSGARSETVPEASRAEVDLIEVAESFSMRSAWISPGERLQWASSQGSQIEFTAGSRRITINSLEVFLGDPVVFEEDSLFISKTDLETTLRPILAPAASISGGRVRLIALDPGHGGSDPGTRNAELGMRESELTLAVAFRLRDLLERRGFRVMLTRETDAFVSLEERTDRAAAAGADLFVSLHFNAVANPAVEGTEAYVLAPRGQASTGETETEAADFEANAGNANDPANALLGYLVQRQLIDDLGTIDRGLKRARFQVLREAECPAVLVEAGFLSHTAEAERLGTAEYQQKLAHSLAVAITRYQKAMSFLSAAHN